MTIQNVLSLLGGLALFLYGMHMMSVGLETAAGDRMKAILEKLTSNRLLGVAVGAGITAVIQSSSATTVMVVGFVNSGLMTLNQAVWIIMGANIGTTITGVFAAIGGSLAAKRTAGLHTLFNVIGTLIGMLLLQPYILLIQKLSAMLNIAPMMQIAVAHILFNVGATILFFPFLKQMCQLVKKLIPGQEPERLDIKIDDLDEKIIHELPASALELVHKSIFKMVDVVSKTVQEAKSYFVKGTDEEDREMILQSEALINSFDAKITQYLMQISKENLSDKEMADLNLNLQVIKNLERIGDLTVNLVEFFEMVSEDQSSFSAGAKDEVLQMFDLFDHMLAQSVRVYESQDYTLYSALLEDENYMDLLEYKARQNHFERMSRQECSSAVAGSVFCDILGNLERMADHTCNIARCAIESTGMEAAEKH